MGETKAVAPFRIALRDYWSSLLLWMGLGAWAVFIFLNVYGFVRRTPPNKSLSEGLFWLAIAVSLVSVVFSMYRVIRIRRTIENGIHVTGKLVSVPPFAGRQAYRVTCEFPFEGKTAVAAIAVEQKRILRWGLKKGDSLSLVVDRTNPKRVIIRDLFCQ